MSYKLELFKDDVLKETFTEQESDFKAFKYILDHTSQSVDYALRYGGWKVRITDEQTDDVTYYEPYDKTKK